MVLQRLIKVRRKRELVFPEHCPNCDHPITGKFCANCGQSVKDFNRPFYSILKDVIGDLSAFDNRLVKTLVPLLVQPGRLTQEFMKGRRMQYMPPFKLYLFLTFIAFFLLSYNHKPDPVDNVNDHLSIKAANGEVFDIEKFISGVEVKDTPKKEGVKTYSLNIHAGDEQAKDTLAGKEQPAEEKVKADNVQGNISKEEKDRFQKILDLYKLNPGIIIDNAFKKLSQTLFAILPLFAIFLWLLYVRRKRYFIEHLLISVNFHSFIFLVVILSELLLMINWSVTTTIAVYLYLTIPIRLFLGMKFYYKQGWIKTFVKFVILSFFYNILLISGLAYSLATLVG